MGKKKKKDNNQIDNNAAEIKKRYVNESKENAIESFKLFIEKSGLKPKENCNKCYGRGYIGYIQAESRFVFCRCITKQLKVPAATLKVEKVLKEARDTKREVEKNNKPVPSPGPKEQCPLCIRKEMTKKHFETDKYWCVNCLACGVPMVVLKQHRANFRPEEIKEIYDLCNKYFPGRAIDYRMKNLKNHAHAHVR